MRIFILVIYTVRELIAKATMIVLASISTLIIIGTAVAFSSHESAEGITLTIFGNPAGPPVSAENIRDFVEKLQAGLPGGLFSGIVLFGIFATSGILPDTLEKGTIDLYLSKPIARWELLLGKYLGAVTVMFVNILYFIGSVWLIFGLKFGMWNVQFLLSVLGLTYLFACLFSIIAFLGVLSRNMAITIIGAFLYLIVIGNALQSRENGLFLISSNSIYRGIIDALYYLLPQLSAVQESVLKLIAHQEADWKPFLQSLLSSALLFGGGAAILQRKDF
jgi:ABC-type transport system involved in multi-copper enzyme maturation permease subunit